MSHEPSVSTTPSTTNALPARPGRRSSRLNRLVLSTSTPTPTRYSPAERPSPASTYSASPSAPSAFSSPGADVARAPPPARGRAGRAGRPGPPRRRPAGGRRAGRRPGRASRPRARTRAPRRPPARACPRPPARRAPPAGPTASAADDRDQHPGGGRQHEAAVVLAHDAGALAGARAASGASSAARPSDSTSGSQRHLAPASRPARGRRQQPLGGGLDARSARPAPSSAHTSAVLPSGRSRSSTLVDAVAPHERHLGRVRLHLLDAHDLRLGVLHAVDAGRSRTRPAPTSRRPSGRRGRARTRSRRGRCTRRARSRRAPVAAGRRARRPARARARSGARAARGRRRRGPRASGSCPRAHRRCGRAAAAPRSPRPTRSSPRPARPRPRSTTM